MQVDLQVVTRDAKLAWEASPTVRAEFADNEAAYLAYRRAEARGALRTVRAPVIRHGNAKPDEQLPMTFAAPLAFQTGALVTLSGAARGRIAGYAAIFGGLNRKGFRLARGAFSDARAPLAMLWLHNQDKPIGRWDVLREDARGLVAEGQINLNVPAGREAFELLSGQDVTGLSVGFRIKPGGHKVVDDVHEVTAADLLEIRVCAVPAEDRARVFDVKEA